MGKYTRKIVQLASAVLYNANIKGFFQGTLYKGNGKYVCAPGLHCYSCPGAVASCPLGSFQSALGRGWKAFPWYVLGLIILFGVCLGRMICSFFCPFGLLQELLHKIPGRKIPKGRWTRRLSWLKYGILAIFVVILPIYLASPAFCQWLCPAGTLEGGILHVLYTPMLRDMLGGTYWWKISLTAAIVLVSVFCFRPFCRFLCPLGAFYGFFNRIAIFGVKCDEETCIHCGKCVRNCRMDVRKINDGECIRCGECIQGCPVNAISMGRKKKEDIK